MLLPLAACFVLTGIHVYFGVHIVKRGIIFVDLALAQLAALGALLGALLGLAHPYFLSLSFTLLGAILLSFTRFLGKGMQEAVIGVMYAVSAALSLILLDRLPSHTHGLHDMMSGQLLFVSQFQVIKMAILYAAIGLLHAWMMRLFSENSQLPFFWDVVFYLSLGVVVTSSVEIAGVLLVFSYLIVPALLGLMWFKSFKKVLCFGWLVGVVVSVIGMWLSFTLDIPTGASIVLCFGVTLAGLLLVRRLAMVFKPQLT